MMLLRLFGALLLSAFFISHAKAGNNTPAYSAIQGGYQIVYGSNGTPILKGSPSVVSAGATTGEALIRDLFKAPGPAGKTIEVSAARRIPWAAIGRVAARASPWVTAGSVIWGAYELWRARPNGDKWEQDAGQPEILLPTWCDTASHQFCAQVAIDAYALYLDSQRATVAQSVPASSTTVVSNPGSCTAFSGFTRCSGGKVRTCYAGGSPCITYPIDQVDFTPTTSGACPGIPDHQNPSYRVNGGPPRGPDGKCPTGVFHPLTDAEAEALADKAIPKDKAKDAVQEMLDHDAEFLPKPAVEISGTPRVESDPRVKTETDAQGNTKTTTTKDVYNITYEGDTYTWNTTTITTNPDGSTTEETDPEPEKVSPPADPDLPEQPKLYDQKYPDGAIGVWNEQSSALHQTPIFQFLAGLNPNLGNGGCPVWSFNPGEVLHIRVMGDLSVPCYVWSFLRVFFTICALLLARRLIFGG